jgi:hypothetical protein
MKRPVVFLVLLAVIPACAFAQSHTDSVKYYSKKLAVLYRNTFDSLKRTEPYRTTAARLKEHAAQSDSYFGLSLFSGVSVSKLDGLNASLNAAGFGDLNTAAALIGVGFSGKYKGALLDFNFATATFGNTAKQRGEQISLNSGQFLQLALGYDVTPSVKVNVYPYAGIHWSIATLQYKVNGLTRQTVNTLDNAFANGSPAILTSNRLGYAAGLGADFLLGSNREKTGGTFLFIRALHSGNFGDENFKNDYVSYKSDVKLSEWMFNVGIKIFRRYNIDARDVIKL